MKADMKKIYLLAHNSDRENLMSALQDFGKLHVSDIKHEAEAEQIAEVFPPEAEFTSSYDPRLSQVHHIIKFLQSFEEREKDPMETFVTLKHPLSINRSSWKKYVEEGLENLDKIAEECHALEERLSNIKSTSIRLEELRLEMEKIKEFSLRLDELQDTEKTHLVLGSFSTADFEAFRKKTASMYVGIKELFSSKTKADVLLVYFKDDTQAAKVLEESGFSQLSVPELHGFKGKPREIISQVNDALEGFVRDEEEIKEKALKVLYKWDKQLFSAHDFLSLDYQRKEGAKLAASSRKTLLLKGWCRKEDCGALEMVAREATAGRSVVIAKQPEKDDSPPVLLVNDEKLKPFEIVTRTFSLPSYDGLDPTPYLAPFFFVFTGICLTDAAYGIALAGISYYFSKRYAQLKNFFTLLMYIGISTAVIGALIGGWVGGLLPIKPLIFDSLADPITFLMLSLALGVVQIVVGISIKMYDNISKKKHIDALYDQGFWLGLIFSMLMIGLSMVEVLPSFLGELANYSAIIFAGGLVLTQGREEKNIIKRLFSGIISLYGLVNYLADVLSYSRLLALGLATGVIGLVLNQIAGMSMGIPIVGIVVATVVLIGGHLFNLAISVMSAYIHSSRLQYVEFFSKFFESGGRAFVPFRQRRDYTNIVKTK